MCAAGSVVKSFEELKSRQSRWTLKLASLKGSQTPTGCHAADFGHNINNTCPRQNTLWNI